MSDIPVIAFSAWSGTGKTTIIEKLISELKSRGLRIAAIKHDAHDFEIDKEGKDSFRFTHAGADVTVISSASKTAMIMQRELDLSGIAAMISDVDLILAEGYNQENIPCIGISRKETGRSFRRPVGDHIALITDEFAEVSGAVPGSVPVFRPDDITGVADFIMNYIRLS